MLHSFFARLSKDNKFDIRSLWFPIILYKWIDDITDYGHPMKPFVFKIQNFWAWADKFLGICGIFDPTISTHFGTDDFYKKLSLYIHIPNIYLGLEFGPQRIWDLAIMCNYLMMLRQNWFHSIMYKLNQRVPL